MDGVECYYVDDSVNIVSGADDRALNDSSVIPVSSVIFAGIGFSGLTKVLKDSKISPSLMRTAPIKGYRQFNKSI